MSRRCIASWGIDRYDNPETIRLKKYMLGLYPILAVVEIGTGRTPKEVIWTRDKVSLYRYMPRAEKRYSVPILLVYALILRPYILDLIPGNSFVEYLLARGFDVYLLDWGVPDAQDQRLSLDTYVLDYLPWAVEEVRSTSHAEGVTVFGYCMGGTLGAIYTALGCDHPVRNLVLLATAIDFAPPDLEPWGLWTFAVRTPCFNPDLVVAAFGNFPADWPARLEEAAASMLRPIIEPAAGVVGLRRRLMPDASVEALLAVSKWVDDGIPFPGRAFRQWIRDFYQRNQLVKGEIVVGERRVDLANITCPVLSIAGSRDVITPRSQAEPLLHLVGSQDKAFLTLDAGHVGLMASAARMECWPLMCDWLAPRSR